MGIDARREAEPCAWKRSRRAFGVRESRLRRLAAEPAGEAPPPGLVGVALVGVACTRAEHAICSAKYGLQRTTCDAAAACNMQQTMQPVRHATFIKHALRYIPATLLVACSATAITFVGVGSFGDPAAWGNISEPRFCGLRFACAPIASCRRHITNRIDGPDRQHTTGAAGASLTKCDPEGSRSAVPAGVLRWVPSARGLVPACSSRLP